MSKVIAASCQAGVVTADGKPVSGVSILIGEGVASSNGILILTGSEKFYVADFSSDLKDVLTTITSLLTNVVTVLTAHDALVAGANAATIASITSSIATLTTKKEALK